MKIVNKERQRRRILWGRRISAIALLLFWLAGVAWAAVFVVLGIRRVLTVGTIGGELLAPLLPVILWFGGKYAYILFHIRNRH